MKRIALSVAILLALISAATAQWNGCKAGFCNVKTASAPTYQGPGDIVSGATIFESCARVYNASLASTSTSMCDLVDSAAPTVVICTLRGSSSGYVDLAGSYCTGGLTPAAKCAAATGGTCRVSKMYNQPSPGTGDFQNGTTSQYPTLTFSGLNSLPGVIVNSATPSYLITTGTFSFTQPNFTTIGVMKPTSQINGTVIGFTSSGFSMGTSSVSSSNLYLTSDSNVFVVGSGPLNSYHSMIGLLNSTSSVFNVDGAQTTGNAGVTNVSSSTARFGRGSGGGSPDATIMEVAAYPVQFTTTAGTGQMALMNTNIHSATSGYNF